jgi:hypothetical protein
MGPGLANTRGMAGPKRSGGKAAKHMLRALGLLALQQLVLARDRQRASAARLVMPAASTPARMLANAAAGLLGVGHLLRQRRHQGGFALGTRIARFQCVIELAHACRGLPSDQFG